MKRAIIIILILSVVSGATVAGYYYLNPSSSVQVAAPTIVENASLETIEIGLDTLVSNVEATGQLEARSEVEMRFETAGMVAEVLVQPGQQVAAGTVLARLRADDLELAIQRAQIDLVQSQAELQQLFEPKLTEKIEAAQTAVASAQSKLAEKLTGPNQDDITKAAADLRKAEITLKQKQWAYDQVSYRGDVGASGEADALQAATLEYEAAQAEYNLQVKGPTTAEINEARSSLAQAKAELAELLRQPSASEIAIKQAAVDKAKIDLREKQSNLEQAVLIAPTDGMVLVVNIEPGERVLDSAQQDPAIVMADISTYLLKVEVDEIDIGQIRRGQNVAITLDALPDQQLDGRVVDLAPRPTKTDNADNSIVTYQVTIALKMNANLPNLLLGMTTNAAIETGRLEKVMLLPSRAIQVDRSSSEPITFVEKLDEAGHSMRVEVQLGQRNESQIQILAGLKEGDKIILRVQQPQEQIIFNQS